MVVDTRRGIEIIAISGRQRLRLQRLADRLASAKQLLAEASAEEDTVRDDLYDLLDEACGPDSYAIYEAQDPHRSWRMVREISTSREFDVEGLRRVLTAAQFRSVTRVGVDAKALGVALARGLVDADVVERYTLRAPRARGPLWKPSTGDIHLAPGQLAVVSRQSDAA